MIDDGSVHRALRQRRSSRVEDISTAPTMPLIMI